MLGAEGWDDVPISSAVRASAALPMVYEPHRIKDRELVDGGIVSTTNLDIAVEAGARFIVVVNPLVPYVNDLRRDHARPRTRRVSDMGFPKIGYQSSSCSPTSACTRWRDTWQERYPGVDIVLIEPEPDDELMFQTDILNYCVAHRRRAPRLPVGHGQLAADYDELREVAQRHGIEISATRVRKVVQHFADEPEKTRAWRRILEQTTGRCCASPPASELTSQLARAHAGDDEGVLSPPAPPAWTAPRPGSSRAPACSLTEHRMLERYRRRYGDVFARRLVRPFDPLVVVADPADVPPHLHRRLRAAACGRGQRGARPAGRPALSAACSTRPSTCGGASCSCRRSTASGCASTATSCASSTEAEVDALAGRRAVPAAAGDAAADAADHPAHGLRRRGGRAHGRARARAGHGS